MRSGTGPLVPHVLRLRVRGPDRRDRPAHARLVRTSDGAADGAIPLALDAPEGPWTLLFEDVATGVKARHRILVQGLPGPGADQ